eukprot:352483-Chlamydomonas_euryale.AAC.11
MAKRAATSPAPTPAAAAAAADRPCTALRVPPPSARAISESDAHFPCVAATRVPRACHGRSPRRSRTHELMHICMGAMSWGWAGKAPLHRPPTTWLAPPPWRAPMTSSRAVVDSEKYGEPVRAREISTRHSPANRRGDVFGAHGALGYSLRAHNLLGRFLRAIAGCACFNREASSPIRSVAPSRSDTIFRYENASALCLALSLA